MNRFKLALLVPLLLSFALADTPPPIYQFDAPLAKTGTHISCPFATGSVSGCLSSVDYALFSAKQSPLTFGNLTDVGTDGITVTGGSASVIGSGTSISQHVADSTHNGYTSSIDWNNFNNKQDALNLGALTDAGTDGITVTNGAGSVIGSGTSISQHVADSTHSGYTSSVDWNNFNNKQAPLTFGNFTVSSPFSVSGGTGAVIGSGLSLGVASGYYFPTTTDQSNWDGAVSALANYLPLSGGSMSGGLDMGGNNFTGANEVDATRSVGPRSFLAHMIGGETQYTISGSENATGYTYLTTPSDHDLISTGYLVEIDDGSNAADIGLEGKDIHLGTSGAVDFDTYDFNAYTATNYGSLSKSGSGDLKLSSGSGKIDLNSNEVINAADPNTAQGLVTKHFADANYQPLGSYESPLTFSSPLSRTSNTISCLAASGSQNGCLSSVDWNTFNNKQTALGFTPLNPANNLSDVGTRQTALNNLVGAVTNRDFLRCDGTNCTIAAIQAADVPTLNQNSTGTAANITASSNSTLTSLPSLSLPYSQLSGAPTIYNQTIQSNATAQTQRSNLNFSSDFSISDSAGSDRTTVALASSVSAVTTLPNLSLPGSQVSGNITGSAGNVTGTVGLSHGGTGVDLSSSGGTSQVLLENSSHVISAARLACSDLSNGATSCSTDTTNASNISSGTLGLSHGGTGVDLSSSGGTSQVLLQNSSHVISAARLACSDLSNSSASCSTDATNASNISSGTLPEARGGTNQSTYTKGDTLYASAANTLSKLAAGTQDQVPAITSTGVPAYRDITDPSTESVIFDDFLNVTQSTSAFQVVTASSGVASGGSILDNTGVGTEILRTTTSATSLAAIRTGGGILILGGGTVVQKWRLAINALSTAADEFVFRVGFGDSVSQGVDHTNGMYFEYNRAYTFTCTGTTTNTSTSVTGLTGCSGVVDQSSIQTGMTLTGTGIQGATTVSVAPGAGTSLTLSQAANASGTVTLTFTVGNYWMYKTAKASTRSTVVSSTAVTAGNSAWIIFEIDVDAGATTITYKVNGSAIGTLTTNIPTAALGVVAVNYRTAFTTNVRDVYIDYFLQKIKFTATR